MVQPIPVAGFVKDFVKNLVEGSAAIFVGAGLSRQEGFVDWRGLLSQIAIDLGLKIEIEHDMVTIAQYHHNAYDRSKLNQLIIDEFTKDIHFGENHELIADLPVHTVWTTNYDKLLEKGFEAAKNDAT